MTRKCILLIIGFLLLLLACWCLSYIHSYIHAQTPPHCSGTAHQICDCMGWPWDEKTKSCPEPKWPTGAVIPEHIPWAAYNDIAPLSLACDVTKGEWLTADGRCHECIVETRKVPVICATTYKHDSTGYHAVITCNWRVK